MPKYIQIRPSIPVSSAVPSEANAYTETPNLISARFWRDWDRVSVGPKVVLVPSILVNRALTFPQKRLLATQDGGVGDSMVQELAGLWWARLR
jgi:hypothetical protein